METFGIIGMSPGNGYFKQEIVDQLVQKAIHDYNHVGIFVPDIPAVSTYIALGYPENVARGKKAIPQGNALKNKAKRALEKIDLKNKEVRIFDWRNENIEDNNEYLKCFSVVFNLYQTNLEFKNDADLATQGVLKDNFFKKTEITQTSITVGVHYLLSEIAFMLFLPNYLQVEKVAYIYHRPWSVFENFIAGKYDGEPKNQILFDLYPQFN
jgi:tRNA-dependent cyclodipeptide synthase